MTREAFKKQVREIALASGFKLKEQPNGEMELNPYVYEFAGTLVDQQQKTIDEQQKRISELEESNLNRATHLDQVQKHNAKLQKRLQENGLEWKDLLEEALRGGQ